LPVPNLPARHRAANVTIVKSTSRATDSYVLLLINKLIVLRKMMGKIKKGLGIILPTPLIIF
jgi:hypothetical protein